MGKTLGKLCRRMIRQEVPSSFLSLSLTWHSGESDIGGSKEIFKAFLGLFLLFSPFVIHAALLLPD